MLKESFYDFLKVTEAASIATLPWIGKNNKYEADNAATNAMRNQLNNISVNGVIVIGEGEIDNAPMLSIGEKVGTGTGYKFDIAVDPIDGTTPIALGRKNGIAVLAVAPRGKLLHAPDMYMEKIAVGPRAAGHIQLGLSLEENLKAVANVNGKRIEDLTVLVQDRPRHEGTISMMRELGIHVKLFKDGDVLQSFLPCIKDHEFDMFYNIGGAPEGVLSAVAIKCLGGEMQARLSIRNDEEYQRCLKMGIENPTAILKHEDLVGSEECFFIATGITDSLFLNGVKKKDNNILTHSVIVSNRLNKFQLIETAHRSLEVR